MATAVFDTEIYKDYFLVAFKNVATGRVTNFESYPGKELTTDELAKIRKIVTSVRLVGFNSINFDWPILSYALAGATNAKLKALCDAIIVKGLKSWQVADHFRFELLPAADHIDVIEVAPGVASLKIYAGRMHAPKMQDLPIEPDASISERDREALRTYCANDLSVTQQLFERLGPQLDLRAQLSKQYGTDLRSKSDAQIAETVIRSRVEKLSGERLVRAELKDTYVAKYRAPDYLRRSSPAIGPLITLLESLDFYVNDAGKIIEPAEFKGKTVKIGASVYRMGIGGLHSSEKKISHYADDDTILVDRDVASYYPNIILGSGLAPENMGEHFQPVYREIVEQRLAAKASGDKVAADTLKITINGSFGKFGSKWSVLYGPELLIQTTLTGQLALLMLIELLEERGISVVSANTDGIVIKTSAANRAKLDNIIGAWELVTGFDTEETAYRSIHSRDVNNYIALKAEGGFKAKGPYAPAGLAKNPTNEICIGAVVKYLIDGIPIDDTIRACTDIKKFISIRTVKGGALDQDGFYLGKAIRWYYATDLDGAITYKINGNKVPSTDGAQALMDLPDELPADLDFDFYINKAAEMLADMGVDHA